ncbi:MAG: hypothetical protein HOH43_06960 [Candidatus Latescibacteria bacterium]|nr:hypothetical protein [Candidatus Latescibacterota bacterium]
MEKALTGKAPCTQSLSENEGWELEGRFYLDYLKDLDRLTQEAAALKAHR